MFAPGSLYVMVARFALALCVSHSLITRADAQDPKRVLEEFGLTKSGKYFLLMSEEDEIIARLNKVLPLVDDLQKMYSVWLADQQIKARLSGLDDERILHQSRLREISKTLQAIPPFERAYAAQRQQLQQELANIDQRLDQIETEQALLVKRAAHPLDVQQHLITFELRKTAFLQAVKDLTPVYERALSRYAEFAKNEQVRVALKELRETSHVNVVLGPSEVVKKSIAKVKNMEKQLNPPQIRSRERTRNSRAAGAERKH